MLSAGLSPDYLHTSLFISIYQTAVGIISPVEIATEASQSVTLWLAGSQPVCLGAEPHWGSWPDSVFWSDILFLLSWFAPSPNGEVGLFMLLDHNLCLCLRFFFLHLHLVGYYIHTYKHMQSYSYIYVHTHTYIYMLFTGLRQSTLCTADQAYVILWQFKYWSDRKLDRREVWAIYIFCVGLHLAQYYVYLYCHGVG